MFHGIRASRPATAGQALPTSGTNQLINREQGSADALAPVCKSIFSLSGSVSPNQKQRRNRRGFIAVILLPCGENRVRLNDSRSYVYINSMLSAVCFILENFIFKLKNNKFNIVISPNPNYLALFRISANSGCRQLRPSQFSVYALLFFFFYNFSIS